MSVRPWHKRYHSDALTGFRPLSLEERGAYQTLLDMIYDTGGSIPDNERYLAGAMNCTMGKWRKLRQSLIDQEKIALDDDGRIMNFRALDELEKSEKQSETLSKSGKKGAKKKKELAKKTNENSGSEETGLKGGSSHIRGQKPDMDELKIHPQGDGLFADGQAELDQPDSRYAFEGEVIRLNKRDFDKWQQRYHAILDLNAYLGTLDDWIADKPEKHSGWFHVIGGALNKKHLAMLAERQAAEAAPSYQSQRDIPEAEREAIRLRLIETGVLD
ncbi:DUF1376 domain-containing protein [Sphingopyxis macrogoltabida]|uniref:DUF1376 domain-containing protein n=1 Tax=Sphingopyxis macrogoltabida TaxID=33050 RepID=A0AAC9FGS5_SPHMC|nr:DUF1376 domain-containing protein [Sphingopyxis macrogoltabida]ALJ15346.1 hypothetical protein LH19_20925 [Sphingopyxis macrogoltabida]AMU91595.1 hypothetical protein ATM17_21505 [Sphingopyxis macrogoltabida]